MTKVKALVQKPMFVYRLFYSEPIFDLDELDTDVVSAVFAAFEPWNVSLENVTVKDNATNLSEEATTFSLLNGKITFSVTPGGCTIAVTNPNWEEVDLILSVCNAGVAAMMKATESEIQKQLASLAMHLTPTTEGSLTGLTSKFVKIDMSGIIGPPLKGFGFSIYRDDLMWVVDRSAHFENSLFVRMDRWFHEGEPLSQIASQLNSDETLLLELIGVEVD